MSKFLDCWDKVYAKGYRHRDGTRVLTRADKKAILDEIEERIKTGEKPLEAAVSAVQNQLAQVDAQMADVFQQAGVKMPREEVVPEPPAPEPTPEVTQEDVQFSKVPSQVFGSTDENSMMVEPSSQGRVDPVIKEKFFDASGPITQEKILKAKWYADAMKDPQQGIKIATEMAAEVDRIDANIVMGRFEVQMMEFAKRLAMERGDTRLFTDLMFNMSTMWPTAVVGVDGVVSYITKRDAAQILSSRSNGQSAAVTAILEVGKDQRQAVSKVIPSGTINEVEKTLDETKLSEADVASIGNTPLPSGGTVAEKINKVRKRKPKTTQQAEQEVQGDATVDEPDPDEPEESKEDRTARLYIDRVDKSQVEFLPPEIAPNPVLQYIRSQENLDGWQEKDRFIKSTVAGLTKLGVDETLAKNTAERIWLRKEAKRKTLAGTTSRPGTISVKDQQAATKAAESFVNAFDLQQTETLLTKKEDNPVTVILKSAMADNDSTIDQPTFEKAVTENLVRVGVPNVQAAAAANRAWQRRAARLVKRRQLLTAKQETRRAKSEAEALLTQLANSQSDTPSMRKSRENETRKLYAEALKSNLSDAALKVFIRNRLVALKTPQQFIEPLVETITKERANRRIVDEQIQLERFGDKLAEASLKPLEKALADAPAALQQSPAWRRRLMLDYFKQLGLSDANAKVAARFYETEFAKKLGDAVASAVKAAAEKSPPWVEAKRKVNNAYAKKMDTQLLKLQKAIRSGVMDPAVSWHEELAMENGWRGFTAEQFARMSEIDNRLTDPSVLDSERTKLLTELNKIIADAKIPPSTGNLLLAHFTASVLGGLSTLNVQFSTAVGLSSTFIRNTLQDPANIDTHLKTFTEGMKTFGNEFLFAIKNDAYRNEVGEHMKGHEQPLMNYLNEGKKNLKSDDPKKKALGVWQTIVGGQAYSMRLLSSIDQASISAAKVYNTSIFTDRALRDLGLTRQQAAELIAGALQFKASAYNNWRESGLDHIDASARATDEYLRHMYEITSRQVSTTGTMSPQEWADDIQRAVELEAEGMVGRRSREVEYNGEGTASRLAMGAMEGISKMLSKGGIEGLATRGIYGFITIPFRTAMWYAGFSPIGFYRYGIHKFQTGRGKASPYGQSYGTLSQERQRLMDAAWGTVLMATAAALASATSDDDPEKSEIKVFITGYGPTDKTVRDAWMKRFKPFSLIIKTGNSYTPINLGRIGESAAWPLALAGAMDDTALNRRAAGLRGRTFPEGEALFGAYIGSLSQRSSFQGLNKLIEIAKTGQQSGQNPKKIVDFVSFGASGMIPWKGMTTSISRLIVDPQDKNTYLGAITSNIPVVGPLVGKPAVNNLGDPINDQSFSGKAFTVGLPIPLNVDTKGDNAVVYNLILSKGRGPSTLRKSDVEKSYGDLSDETFYQFTVSRGRRFKAALIRDAESIKAMDNDQYAAYLEKLSRSINPQVAKDLGLSRQITPTQTGLP